MSVHLPTSRWIAGRHRLRWLYRGALVLGASFAFALATAGAAAAAEVNHQTVVASAESAMLEAAINPLGNETTCEAEYVSQLEFEEGGWADGTLLPCSPANLGSGEGYVLTSATLSGLADQTAYRYRFLTTTGGETHAGPEEAFTTSNVNPLVFGFSSFAFETLGAPGESGEPGQPFTQAGGHPYVLKTSIYLTRTSTDARYTPDGIVKDLLTELPAGLVGNPDATPRCAARLAEEDRCSGESQLGLLAVRHANGEESDIPLFNVTAPEGVAASIVGEVNGSVDGFIDAGVRTGEGYGITAGSYNLTQRAEATGFSLELWGVPAEASHDAQRSCSVKEAAGYHYVTPCTEKGASIPYFSEPTSCSGQALTVNAAVDSYENPGEFASASTTMPAITGCEKVSFNPSIAVTPESSSSDSPTGVQVNLKVPQDEEAAGLATANLKDATVSLPAGMTVNPAEASGLAGCPLLTGKEAHAGQSGIDLEDSEPANCPEASKIGTIELDTPLVDHPLPGAIYLAQQGNDGPAQGSNPFGSLLAMYIAIDDPITGVVVKLAGQITANPTTGQLSATFNENPQLPFEELKLHFFSGERAPLATPMDCGTYQTTSLLEPWSHTAPGETGTPDASPSGSFAITSLAGGGACGTPPFAPTLTAGTSSNQAGGFGPLTTIIQRKDGEQSLKSVSVTLPKGLAGLISQVPQCGEAQADAGTCSAASQIGNVTVDAGVGDEPLTLPEAGRQEDPVYLTGPFEGAPFGLSIVVHPEAGPFNLEEGGHPVVVRAGISVNPNTAQVTITTPSSGPYAMPTILHGIPVDIQAIDVSVDRPDFTFNPTSCEPMDVTGTIGSAEGASAAVSSRYQAADCSSLKFKPKLTASTKAKNSRKSGASLTVKIGYPDYTEANIAKVKVQLPKALPTREETLQYSCTEAQFNANPADCPEGSLIGTAKAITPILKAPLEGPVYFVSYGHAKFPDVIAVLQAEGVTIDLAGTTFISKGITTSTFGTVPDEPVSSFQLTLNEGRHSALTARGQDICDDKLQMPTQITGQNGAFIEQKTSIKVEGCSKKIAFTGHKVSKRDAKVTVYVPAAGKLKASGKGLKTKSKTAKGRGTVSFQLRQKKAGKLHTTVKVTFKPKKGKKQTKKLKLEFKK